MPHKVVPLQKQQEVSETSGGWRTVPLQPQLLVSSDWCVSLPTDSVTVKVSALRSESASSFHGQNSSGDRKVSFLCQRPMSYGAKLVGGIEAGCA